MLTLQRPETTLQSTPERPVRRWQAPKSRIERNANARYFALLALIFAAALAVRLIFNHCQPYLLLTIAGDAHEYLTNANALLSLKTNIGSTLEILLGSLLGFATPADVAQVRQALEPLKGLSLSGPSFPAFLALCFAVSNQAALVTNSNVVIIGQCLLSAFTGVLVAKTAEYCFDRRTAVFAGLLAAFYPALILHTQRICTETFGAFLVAVACCIVARGFVARNSPWLTVVLGFSLVALQLTRPLMVILTLATVAAVWLQRKKPFDLLPLFVGVALAIAPWLAFTKVVYGKADATVDRAAYYNLFVGNDMSTRGWPAYPYNVQPLGKQADIRDLVKVVPFNKPGWYSLLLDKPVRFLKFPCNDFRVPFFGAGFAEQVVLHQLYLMLAAIGALLGLTISARHAPENPQLAARLFLLATIAIHCGYFLFDTVGRYNLTAMPEIIVFSAAGLLVMAELGLRAGSVAIIGCTAAILVLANINVIPLLMPIFQNAAACFIAGCIMKLAAAFALSLSLWKAIPFLNVDGRKARLSIKIGAACLILLFALPLRSHGRWFEWSHAATSAEPVRQSFALPPDFDSDSRQWFLMIDTDRAHDLSENTVISINGQRLDSPVIPSLALIQDFHFLDRLPDGRYQREIERIFDTFARAAARNASDLRQWQVIAIPQEVAQSMGRSGRADVTVTPAQSCTVYGAYTLRKGMADMPGCNQYSWDKCFYGVENNRGFSDMRYDQRIREDYGLHRKNDLSSEPGLQNGRFNICLMHAQKPDSASRLNRHRLKMIESVELSDPSSPSFAHKFDRLPPFGARDLWAVRLTGQLKTSLPNGHVRLSVTGSSLNGAEQIQYVSPWAVRDYSAAEGFVPFALTMPIEPSRLPGSKLREIDVNALAFTWPASTPATTATLKNLKLEIFSMPSNPPTSLFGVH